MNILFGHYGISNEEEIINKTRRDWRFVIPTEIIVDGLVPRTPYVLLEDDPKWKPCDQLEPILFEMVRARIQTRRRR